MKNSYSQFYNYAKGMYQESTDVWEDMKRLVADRSMIEPQFVSIGCIVGVLLDAVFQLENNPKRIRVFMDNLSPMSFYKWVVSADCKYIGQPHPDYDYNIAVREASLSLLRQAQVFDTDEDGVTTTLIELDKPNPVILPLSKFGKQQIEYLQCK